jgi:hypothetical protein
MKRTTQTLILLLFSISLFSQTFTYNYSYDAAGNRTGRVVGTLKSAGGESIYDRENKDLRDDFKPQDQFNDELAGLKVVLYPNPTRGELVIGIDPFNEAITGSISVIGTDGRVLYTIDRLSGYNDIDLENVSSGSYILKLTIGESSKAYTIIRQ